MMNRCLTALVLVGLLANSLPAAEAPADLNDLSLEVLALQMLHSLDLTAAQLKAMAALAKTTAERGRNRDAVEGATGVRKLLADMREALLTGNEQRIAALGSKFDSASDQLDALDDGITITAAARNAPRRFSAR